MHHVVLIPNTLGCHTTYLFVLLYSKIIEDLEARVVVDSPARLTEHHILVAVVCNCVLHEHQCCWHLY